MNKSIKLIAVLMALLLVLCGCAKKDDGEFSYSRGIKTDGYWDGIKASDYVKLCDLSNIQISQADIDKDVQTLLEKYQKSTENKSRAVVDKDTVNIDYVGSIDGVEFDGGSTKGQGTEVTIGVTSYIDNFLEQLIGHKPGETFDINVTFPDPYPNNPDLAGKPAVFKTTINYVVDYEKYELGDDFVKTELYDLYGWKTVKDMNEGIKAYFVEDYIIEKSEIVKDVPEIMTTQFVESSLHELSDQAASYGLDSNTLLSLMYGLTLQEFKDVLELDAEDQAKTMLIYQAIAEQKNMKVSLSELNKWYAANGITDSKQIDYVLDRYGKGYLTSRALYDKVSDYIGTLGTIK